MAASAGIADQMRRMKKVTGETSKLIRTISKAGDRYGNLLLEFMETYGLTGLYQATAEQLREFISKKNLEVKR